MSKEQKPTLGSGAIKTRKRNIHTKNDPEAFRDKIFAIFDEAGGEVKQQLSLLDDDSLDYQRYGEVFAEILLAGNIVMPGGSVNQPPTEYCVFAAETDDDVLKTIDLFHQLMRRKPFLRTRLDNVMTKLLLCGSVFSEKERTNLAKATVLLIQRNMITVTVLQKLSTKACVESGFSLNFFMTMISEYTSDSNGEVDKLLVLLKNAKLDQDALLEMMPPKDRSQEALNAKLTEHGLEKLVEQYEKKKKQGTLVELAEGVKERIDDKIPPAEIHQWVLGQAEVSSLNDKEVLHCVWDGIAKDEDASRKAHQKRALLLSNINTYSPLLEEVCEGDMMEQDLIIRIQNFIAADMEMLNSGTFRDAVNLLYRKDVLSEEAIHTWYRRIYTLNKGSAASSNILRDQMTPFIKWLETAEEESD
uniref:W2 domain-containing protein n=3 Tax=Rhodosorus marinus TaxID=101924 RepID=A0A7S2ZKH4_9RHOD|mmetsp:Transcript_22844/g.91441  ORF Transcript_22844/g.91441 Transcript_22844/m.91441 type:complete len:416 (+) Transcript_22844:117-1364(+)